MSEAMNSVALRIERNVAFASGREFGDVGSYRLIEGRAHFVIDPKIEQAFHITDLRLTPTCPAGYIRFAADFCLLVPTKADRGNNRLLFEFANRGNKLALRFFNDSPAGNMLSGEVDPGNGFLFRQGYSIAWLAWQGDLWPGNHRMLLDAPVAMDGDAPVTGAVRREFIVESDGVFCQPLSGNVTTRGYPSFRLDNASATLTKRQYPQDERQPIPRTKWHFAREDRHGAERAVIPDTTYLYLEEGFEPGWIYELVYIARDPLVLGVGYVAVRRFLAHLRKQAPSLPFLGSPIEKIYAWGHSQSSRVLRDFIYGGFNADDEGHRLSDGALVHGSGAGRMWLNHRFANGSSMAGQQFEEHYNFADRFPFGYGTTTDHLTGRTDAICKRPATDPLIMHVQTSSEYWQRRASLVHTDTRGQDIDVPGNVRIYHLASSQHFPLIPHETAEQGICSNPGNSLEANFFLRALLLSLDRWATDGTLPPDSRYPRRCDNTLVSCEGWREQFPMIPGAAVPSATNTLPLLYFGPMVAEGVLQTEPPECLIENAYPIFLPAVDVDGNEIAGLRSPLLEVPSATYTGWNMRRAGQGEGYMYRFAGSAFAFATTKQARSFTGDTRLSLAERYLDADDRHRRIVEAAARLCEARLLLEEDVERIDKAAKPL